VKKKAMAARGERLSRLHIKHSRCYTHTYVTILTHTYSLEYSLLQHSHISLYEYYTTSEEEAPSSSRNKESSLRGNC